ncbi:MAG: Receptor family ligand binding region [Parcubacteria group bacterium]|nr:Receptor family ligand binding region [Parcubacteria group bacterium]
MFFTKKRFIFSAIIVAIVAIVAVSVLSNKGSVKKTDIKIGVILPLSGDLASVGEDVAKGVRLFAQNHNDGKFIIEDDGGESKKSINAMRKLVNANSVGIFFGPLGPISSEAVYSSQAEKEKNDFIFVAMSMCVDQFKSYKNMICNYPSPYFQLRETYRYLASLGKKNFYVILVNDALGESFLQMLRAVSKELSLNFIGSEKINVNDLEFRTIAQKAIQGNPEFITIATANQSANIKVIKAIKEKGYKGMILSGGDFEEKMVKEFRDVLDGVYMAGQAKLDYGSDFVNSYSQKYGGSPNLYAAFGYAWGDILYELIKTNPKRQFSADEIMDSVNSRSGELAIKGMKFDKTKKEIKFPMQVFRVENGNLKSVFVSSGE